MLSLNTCNCFEFSVEGTEQRTWLLNNELKEKLDVQKMIFIQVFLRYQNHWINQHYFYHHLRYDQIDKSIEEIPSNLEVYDLHEGEYKWNSKLERQFSTQIR